MAWREIFGFYLGAAAGAIKFHDADPEWVGSETERAGDYWWMNFAGVAIVDEAAFFIIFAGGAEIAIAAIAEPFFLVDVDVEIFGDANSIWCVWHFASQLIRLAPLSRSNLRLSERRVTETVYF